MHSHTRHTGTPQHGVVTPTTLVGLPAPAIAATTHRHYGRTALPCNPVRRPTQVVRARRRRAALRAMSRAVSHGISRVVSHTPCGRGRRRSGQPGRRSAPPPPQAGRPRDTSLSPPRPTQPVFPAREVPPTLGEWTADLPSPESYRTPCPMSYRAPCRNAPAAKSPGSPNRRLGPEGLRRRLGPAAHRGAWRLRTVRSPRPSAGDRRGESCPAGCLPSEPVRSTPSGCPRRRGSPAIRIGADSYPVAWQAPGSCRRGIARSRRVVPAVGIPRSPGLQKLPHRPLSRL